ncbi:MAG: hypothetical protein HFE62_01920 [Firmicutes bacterium]|nr:hypothetical protein [Bacillota bacterium]
MGYYEEERRISYYEADFDLKLKPASMTTLFQDLAIFHSDSLGYTIKSLLDQNRGWIITNWHIDILRYPLCGETVWFRTWASSTRHMLAERSYSVVDKTGNEIAKANSRWVFMDLEKRRPASVSEEMRERYESGLEPAIENEKYRVPHADEENLIDEKEIVVRRSETDTNGHTNNVQYISWAMDCVPDSIYCVCQPVDIKVAYRRESYRGDRVRAKTYKKETESGLEIITVFSAFEDDRLVYCETAALWKAKEI